jgi:hypothetical protein
MPKGPSDSLKMPSSALIEDVSASIFIAREPEDSNSVGRAAWPC